MACLLVRSACCVIAFHAPHDSLSLLDFLQIDLGTTHPKPRGKLKKQLLLMWHMLPLKRMELSLQIVSKIRNHRVPHEVLQKHQPLHAKWINSLSGNEQSTQHKSKDQM